MVTGSSTEIHTQSFPGPLQRKSGWPWSGTECASAANVQGIRDWPRITVVTPSFNQGQFLEETIRSVLMQGYPNLEYIVMDGGSHDSSLEVIKHYASWLTHWESEKDGGQADAIIKGFARGTGQILAWLNSDDLYQPGALFAAAKCFRADPGLGVAYGSCETIDAVSRCQAIHAPPDFSLVALLKSNFIAQPATFFSQSLWMAIGLDARRHYAFDYELWVRAAVQGYRFRRVSGVPWAGFRVWEQSKSETSYEKFIQEITAIATEVFDGGGRSTDLQPLRGLAMASGWRFAALGYWGSGQGAQARRCVREIFRLWPKSCLEPKLLFIFLASFFGKDVTIALRNMKRSVNRRVHHRS